MNQYEQAGRLLVLARELRDTDTRSANAVERAAKLAAEQGTSEALGFIGGWWYSTGNTLPMSNYAWRNASQLLGRSV